MWDRKVVEKVDEAVGLFSVSCKFRCIANQYDWASQESMVRILMGIGG